MEGINPFTPLPTTTVPVRSIALVIGSGLLTTFVTLVVVQILGMQGTFVMGWYANYILPVGAILVGLAATSGYALGSWYGGAKLTGRLAGMVAGLSFAAYVLAQYGEYQLTLASLGLSSADVGFFSWFDLATRAFAWEDHGKMGKPLESLGYLLRLGEVVGFVGGGVLMPIGLGAYPYCDGCARYYRSRKLGTLSAGLPKRGIFGGGDKAEWENRQAELLRLGILRLERLARAGGDGNVEEWHREMDAERAELGEVKADKLESRIGLTLYHCPSCAAGFLKATHMVGHGRQMNQREVLKRNFTKEVVTALR